MVQVKEAQVQQRQSAEEEGLRSAEPASASEREQISIQEYVETINSMSEEDLRAAYRVWGLEGGEEADVAQMREGILRSAKLNIGDR